MEAAADPRAHPDALPRRRAVSKSLALHLEFDGAKILDPCQIRYPMPPMLRPSVQSDTSLVLALLGALGGVVLYFSLWVYAWLSAGTTWKEMACLLWAILYIMAIHIRRQHAHHGGDLGSEEFPVPLLLNETNSTRAGESLRERSHLNVFQSLAQTAGTGARFSCLVREGTDDDNDSSTTTSSDESTSPRLMFRLLRFGKGRRGAGAQAANILDFVGDVVHKDLRARTLWGMRIPNVWGLQMLLLGRHEADDKVFLMSILFIVFFVGVTLVCTFIVPAFSEDDKFCKDGEVETVTNSRFAWVFRIGLFSLAYPACVNLALESHAELLHLLDYFDVLESLTTSDLMFLDISGRAVFRKEVYKGGYNEGPEPNSGHGEIMNRTTIEKLNIIRQAVRTWLMLHRYLLALAGAITPLVERTVLLTSAILIGSSLNLAYSWLIQVDHSRCSEIGQFHVWMGFHITVFGYLTQSLCWRCMQVNTMCRAQSSVLACAASELWQNAWDDGNESDRFHSMVSNVADMLLGSSHAIERTPFAMRLYGFPITPELLGRGLPLLGSSMGLIVGAVDLPRLKEGMLP